MSQSIEGIYLLLILIGASTLKGLHKRAQGKKEIEKKITHPGPYLSRQQPICEPPPSVKIKKTQPVELSKVVQRQVLHRKKKPRIGKLVSGLKNKKDLVLLSEILVNKQSLN